MKAAPVFELTSPSLAAMLRSQSDLGQATTIKGICKAVSELRGSAPDADIILAAWRQALHFGPAAQQVLIEFIEDELESD